MRTRCAILLIVGVASILGGCADPKPIEIEMIELDVGEFRFRARTAGPETGPVVILLHGFPATSRGFHALMLRMAAAGFRAVAPDLRGYSPGARPSEDSAYALTAVASDVPGFADALGASKVHVVGHDWGAAVGWFAAALYPDRVATLTAISIPHPEALRAAMLDPASGQREASAYTEVLRRDGAEVELLANDAELLRMFYGEDPGDGAADAYGVDVASGPPVPDAIAEDYLDVLSDPTALSAALAYYRVNWGALESAAISLESLQVQSPTLQVWGDQDFSVTYAAAEGSQRFVEGPYAFKILSSGHFILETAGEALSDAVLRHLEENTASSTKETTDGN